MDLLLIITTSLECFCRTDIQGVERWAFAIILGIFQNCLPIEITIKMATCPVPMLLIQRKLLDRVYIQRDAWKVDGFFREKYFLNFLTVLTALLEKAYCRKRGYKILKNLFVVGQETRNHVVLTNFTTFCLFVV